MRLLLDSDVFLWIFEGVLDDASAERIQAADEMMVSAATVWELGIKRAKGKLELPEDPLDAIARHRFGELDVTMLHAATAAKLPRIHMDPFDRMLVAQAQIEGLVLATSDRKLAEYDIETLAVPRPAVG